MKKRILIIDDEPIMTQWISVVLNSTDRYQADGVNDPLEAHERASKIKYDLLISDIQMPKMNGDILYRCLDTDPETGAKTTRRPKMILMSGALDDQALGQTRQMVGAIRHLQKPFRPEALLETVDAILSETD
jgi:CheY-like chemotaxis protein